MKKTTIFLLFMLMLAGCGNKPQPNGAVNSAYRAQDYQRLLLLADSLQQTGGMGDAESFYWQGYASDRLGQHRAAEFYWRSAMRAVEHSADADDLAVYAKSASRLTNVLGVRNDYESAMEVAVTAARHLEQQQCDTTSDYTNLLIFIGCCQLHFGMPDDSVNTNFGRAQKMHLSNIAKTQSDAAYKNAIAGFINIAYNCIGVSKFKAALDWTDRYGKLISQYEQRNDIRDDYVDKQWARYNIYRAIALEGLGRHTEAATVFADFQRTQFAQTPEGRIDGASFLTAAGRWGEAAESYSSLDEMVAESGLDYTLETIHDLALKKYRTNVQAGRQDSANAVACRICESLDSAITQSRRMDVKEQAVIREKEAQMAEREAGVVNQRMMATLATLLLLIACFAVITWFRRKSARQLKKSHKELKAAYAQLAEETAVKTRIDNERTISHAIQSEQLCMDFPDRADVKLYATLKPAEEMCGDFYDFLIRDEKLYFCIGDVKGKGVPAALTMAVLRAQFRSASAYESRPDSIVATINKHLTEGKNSLLPASLFVGVLHLATGRLHYANAGHSAPLLVGSGIGLLPAGQNDAVGLQADAQFKAQEATIDPGTVMFLYTDGVPSAENAEHEPFTEKRIGREALQAIHGLDPTPQPFVERMEAAVHRFVGDTKQGDDMTMMAIRYLGQTATCYQRSLSLSNDIKEMPYLTHFTEEVCTAMRFDKQTTADILLAMKETVTHVMRHAYPDNSKGDVHIEARADEKQLTFVIRDQGLPFNPAENNIPEEMRQAQRCMDSVNYERIDDQNVLTLVKNSNSSRL